jgi:glycine/D-amino acid oxidase-like deaminating enzyme
LILSFTDKHKPLDLQSGYPYSLIRYGLPYDYPRLDHDIRTDVAVIGGGVSGALTAYRLTEAGIPCVVLDARTIGLGSTCASTSLLQYEIDVPLCRLGDKIGATAAGAAYMLCADAIDALEQVCRKVRYASFERRQSLYLASYKKDMPLLEAEYEARRKLGLKVSFWDAATVEAKMGFAAPGAIFSAQAGQIDAYLFTHALHQYNLRRRSQVYDRTPVVNIDFNRRGVTLHTARRQRIHARYLVVATGYEAVQYIKEPLVQLRSTYAVASETLPPQPQYWYRNCLIWETKDPYLYFRMTPDNRILAGGRDEDFYNPGRRDRLIAAKARALARDVKNRFPHIPFVPEFRWTGTFGATTDGLPYIGAYHRMPRTYFALGFGGNGITFSEVAAGIVRDLILGKKSPHAPLFSFERILRNL